MVERIRTLLESRQLTPTQFADLIGVARPIVSHILSGRNKPSLDVVQRILAAMPDLSMAWLLNGTGPMLAASQEDTPIAPAPGPAVIAPSAALPPQPAPPVEVPPAAMPAVPPQLAPPAQGRGLQSPTNEASMPVVPRYVAAANTAPNLSSKGVTNGRPAMPRRFPVKPSVVALAEPAVQVAPPTPGASEPVAPIAAPALALDVTPSPGAPVSTTIPAEKVPLTPSPSVPPAVSAPEVAGIPHDGVPVAAVVAGVPQGELGHQPIATTGDAPANAPTLANDMASALFTGAEKPIRRIVIFYRDGSFADYQPE